MLKQNGNLITRKSSLLLIIVLMLCSCDEKLECDVSNEINLNTFIIKVDRTLACNESLNIELDSIIKFEKSIGATILFNNFSEDSLFNNNFYQELLNTKRKGEKKFLKPGYYSFGKRYKKFLSSSTKFDSNYESSILTHLVSLRPQNHSFLKEVAVYGADTEYQTFYFINNKVLDALIPPELSKNYSKEFKVEDFWCFKTTTL